MSSRVRTPVKLSFFGFFTYFSSMVKNLPNYPPGFEPRQGHLFLGFTYFSSMVRNLPNYPPGFDSQSGHILFRITEHKLKQY